MYSLLTHHIVVQLVHYCIQHVGKLFVSIYSVLFYDWELVMYIRSPEEWISNGMRRKCWICEREIAEKDITEVGEDIKSFDQLMFIGEKLKDIDPI